MLNKFKNWLFPTTVQREEAIEEVYIKIKEARCEVSIKIEEIVWFHNNESRFLEDYHDIDLEVIDWGEDWKLVNPDTIMSTAIVHCPESHRYFGINRRADPKSKEIDSISEDDVYLVQPTEVTTTIYKRLEL